MPDKKIARSSDSNRLRQRAEKMLEEAKGKSLDCESSNTAELVHELQVHQIELEVQNEELRQSQVNLEEARVRYADLYDFAPTGYLTLDKANLVIEANLTICNMLGIDRADLLKNRISDYVAPESQEDLYITLREIRRTGTKKVCELKMVKTDKSAFYAQFESTPARENTLRSAIVDISEQRKAREILARAKDELEINVKERTEQLSIERQRFYIVLETLPVMVCLLAPDYHVVFANKAFRDKFGESKGRYCYDYCCGFDKPCSFCESHKPFETGNPHHWEFTSPDGNTIIDAYDFPFTDVDGSSLVLEMDIDITERKKAEEALGKSREELVSANKQLKQYAHKITQVQEEERKRIAYELHDDTAQYLSILKMQIGALANSEEILSPKVKEKLQFLEKDADRAFNDVRRYSHELRPTTLEHQGLVGALEQITDDFNKLGQLAVEIHVSGMEPELSEEVKLGFFRIAQEALNNARKHSKASQVEIDLRFNHKNLSLIVSDNGEGFNAKEALRKSSGKGSPGLMSMRERANLINADLKIESESGKGTKVILKAKI